MLCAEYHQRFATGLGYGYETDFQRSLETYVVKRLYDQRFDKTLPPLDPASKDCANIVWSWLSPEADPWRYKHADLLYGWSIRKDGRRTLYNDSIFPTFILLARNFHNGNPRQGDHPLPGRKPNEILIDLDNKEGETKETEDWIFSSDEWADAQSFGDAPPVLNENDPKETIANVSRWLDANKDVVELLTEPNLIRLRNCDPRILENLRQNQFIGARSVQEYCPDEKSRRFVR